MSLREWLIKKLSGDNNAELKLSAQEKQLSGLNLQEVLGAHLAWKEKLNSTLAGRSVERYDVVSVSQDNLCVLGKWLYGPGAKKYSRLPEYDALKKIHTEFHLSAAEVLREHKKGNLKAASQIFNGKFRDASNLIQLDLVSLFSTVRG